QFWPAIPGTVEHPGAVSGFAVLLAAAALLVAQYVLSGPPVLGGIGNVLSGATMDGQPHGSVGGRHGLGLQWPDAQLSDVAQQYCRSGLDALGGSIGGAGMENGRPGAVPRSGGGHHADVGGRAGNNSFHLGDSGPLVDRKSVV